MKTNIAIACLACLSPGNILAQQVIPPPVEWQRSFGGTNDDRARALTQTADGGCLVGGFSNSRPASGSNGNKTSSDFGNYDFWIVRLDALGNKLWDQTYGGTGEDVLFSVQETRDGGFLLGGYTASGASGNKRSGNFGGYDFWVVRVDAQGARVWDQVFGGTDDDYLRSLTQTADGGFLIGGQSLSAPSGNKTSPLYGTNDFWIVRLSANGSNMWDRSFGGSGPDRLQSLQQTSDGGFILGGVSLSGPSGNKSSPNYGLNDYWIVRLDAAGNKLWDRSFGGTDNDELLSLVQTADGGFILGGFSWSGANGNKTTRNSGSSDFWVVRTDANGNKLWEQSFGGRDSDSIRSLAQTRDGGFILGGISASGVTGNKTSPYYGGTADFWVVRLDAAGNRFWEQSFGGTGDDGIWSLQQAADGGFLLSGGSDSVPGGNKTSPNFGNYDFWVVKLRPDAPRLRAPLQTPAEIRQNGFRLLLTGVSNNFYRTEYTSNWTTWTPLQTNQVTGSDAAIVDRGASNAPRRYYRARLLP
jgi:hypothetical protein